MKYSAFHFDIKTYRNYGDTILFELVRQTFNCCHEREVFFVNKTRNLRQPFGQQTVTQINQSDLLILGGGGLFLKDSVANSRSGWQWQCSYPNLEKIETPLVLFAVGNNRFIGQEDFDDQFIKHLNKTVEKAIFVGLRNHGSINTIKPYLKPELRDKLKYQPCPTTIGSFLCPDIYNPIRIDVKKKIAFNAIIGNRQRAAGLNPEAIYAEILKAIRLLKKDNWEIEVVAHNRGDLGFNDYLLRNGIKLKVVELFGENVKKDLYCGLKYYADMPFVFGIRGHAGMISFGMGGIPFTVEVHNKLRYFQEDIGLPDYCMDPKEENWGEKLYRKISEAYENYPEIRHKLDSVRSNFYEITARNLAEIHAKIDKIQYDDAMYNRMIRFSPYSQYERKLSELTYAESLFREKFEYK